MALTTTPEVLRELAALYTRIAELERTYGMRPGEGAPAGTRDTPEDLAAGLGIFIEVSLIASRPSRPGRLKL
jgi:hypothetical protein